MQSFCIHLDNGLRVFQPGSQVSGALIVSLKEALEANAIYISVNGGAYTRWTESETHSRTVNGKRETVHTTVFYSGSEEYVTGKATLWASSCSQKFLPPGTYRFPFSFILPPVCAPSFEGQFGCVRYYLKANLDRPWKFDKTTKVPFDVMPVFDLNLIPNAAALLTTEKDEKLGILFFKHGRVRAKATLLKGGYVPGESISAEVSIVNESTKVVQKVQLKVKQLASFTAYRQGFGFAHHRYQNRTVCVVEEAFPVQPSTSSTYQKLLPIPPTVPSFNNCSIIQVEYQLRIKITAKGRIGNTVKMSLPLLIGTIPVHYNPATQPSSNANGASIYPILPTAPPCDFDAPPAYEECVFGKGVLEDEDNVNEFSPRYPFYRNLSIPAPAVANATAPPLDSKFPDLSVTKS